MGPETGRDDWEQALFCYHDNLNIDILVSLDFEGFLTINILHSDRERDGGGYIVFFFF